MFGLGLNTGDSLSSVTIDFVILFVVENLCLLLVLPDLKTAPNLLSTSVPSTASTDSPRILKSVVGRRTTRCPGIGSKSIITRA